MGFPLNHPNARGERPPFAMNGQTPLAILDWLAQQGFDFNLRGPHQETLAHTMALNGHLAALQKLQALGVSLNEVDQQGLTPFHYAMLSGDHATLDFLAEHDAKREGHKGPSLKSFANSFGLSFNAVDNRFE
uniref:Uncharacterized protein n=1 Tax=Magnetococcus massalia (strain MO-1) TaxID=451514 RepID=A0A1S7LEV1_MAGMO|nr:protein of unknown function [Candidatus Magnetococcus massalia]